MGLYEELQVLPPLKEAVKAEAKRFAKAPDTTLLTEHQQQSYKELIEFLEDEDATLHLLSGYAGVGKSYLTNMFTEHCLGVKNKRVAVTAPTNKAVKVLRDMGQFKDANLQYSTIHSLLGLKEQIDGYGKQSFVQDRGKHADDPKVGDFDIIIIDEASMVQDDLLIGASKITGLFEYANMFNFKILFVGDECQIPPVGKDRCLPFEEESQETFGIKVSRLTEIVRQAEDNPIIKLTLAVRKALGRDIVLPVMEDEYTEDLSGVFFLDADKKEVMDSLMQAYFTSDNFKQDADFAKVIAYRNKTVDMFNKRIRKMIYGSTAKRIEVGEKLIANKPILRESDNKVLFTTNDEFEVESFEEVQGDYKGAELWFYDARVKSTTASGDLRYETIRIVHEKSLEDYSLILDHLKELAMNEKKGSWEAASKWKDFYKIQNIFADVNYNYAITSHKSQGSTYVNTFVVDEDINVNRKIKERNRIKYTAYTRPSSRLFVIV